jgi:hypothetical protein
MMTMNMMPPGQQNQGQPGQGAPAPAAAPAATPVATTLEQRWAKYFESPSVRAAAMQFGLGMLQPMPAGQTPAGHVAMAIGDAAQAAHRVDAYGHKVRTDEAELQQGQQQIDVARDRNTVDREQLDETKNENIRRDAREKGSAAYQAEQDKLKNDLDARRVAAYETMAAKSGSAAAAKDPVLEEKLDMLRQIAIDRSTFEEDFDPIAYFDEQVAKMGGGAAPVTSGGTGVAPVAPKVGEVQDGYKFLGGNPNDPNAWQKVK